MKKIIICTIAMTFSLNASAIQQCKDLLSESTENTVKAASVAKKIGRRTALRSLLGLGAGAVGTLGVAKAVDFVMNPEDVENSEEVEETLSEATELEANETAPTESFLDEETEALIQKEIAKGIAGTYTRSMLETHLLMIGNILVSQIIPNLGNAGTRDGKLDQMLRDDPGWNISFSHSVCS